MRRSAAKRALACNADPAREARRGVRHFAIDDKLSRKTRRRGRELGGIDRLQSELVTSPRPRLALSRIWVALPEDSDALGDKHRYRVLSEDWKWGQCARCHDIERAGRHLLGSTADHLDVEEPSLVRYALEKLRQSLEEYRDLARVAP